ncbi:hypothetical protein OEZ86_009387 [Tetradesmus obliquus]|nr:hypothetical protein OEZ86_009387 [Tetradesmus obliquus]
MSDKKVLIVFGATGTVGQALLNFVVKEAVMGEGVKALVAGRKLNGSLGQALCFVVKEAVVGEGVKVVAIGTDDEKCKKVEKQFENVTAMAVDAKDIKQVTQVFEKHKEEGILGVVNLMGDYHYCAMEDLEDADVMTMMQDNLATSFNVLMVGAPALAEGGGGSIACVGGAETFDDNLATSFNVLKDNLATSFNVLKVAAPALAEGGGGSIACDNLATSFNALKVAAPALAEGGGSSIACDNLATSFNVLKVGAPALAEGGGGSIACVGAAVVHYGMKNHEAWAAAKGAVEGALQLFLADKSKA